ncbi:5-deoxy-glucuronate isomerase [Angustibacter luteus]|uniref:5-deoxy-glucuronate isomerase n=1 Tax=Angustibacter luteus TaxID=658456 RepID=A0ABW1JIY6_9ACTN
MSTSQWVLPLGSAARDGFDVVVDDQVSGWTHTGLRVATLAQGDRVRVPAGPWEYVVVPLSGSADVEATLSDGSPRSATLAGRASVFAGPTDVVFAPAGSACTLTGVAPTSRIAVCAALVAGAGTAPFQHLAAADVPVELRGAGVASREVRNFGTPGVLQADAIIACEVITPAGNWSSYPPHKHDEERAGVETELEEIYYFECQVEGAHDGRDVRTGADPVGYQRVYGTADRPIDVFAEVRSGDVVLVPHGWHGPAMAPPGYDLYYLNVMAGPGPVRAWLICDDPAHAWVRDSWAGLDVDPRLRPREEAR